MILFKIRKIFIFTIDEFIYQRISQLIQNKFDFINNMTKNTETLFTKSFTYPSIKLSKKCINYPRRSSVEKPSNEEYICSLKTSCSESSLPTYNSENDCIGNNKLPSSNFYHFIREQHLKKSDLYNNKKKVTKNENNSNGQQASKNKQKLNASKHNTVSNIHQTLKSKAQPLSKFKQLPVAKETLISPDQNQNGKKRINSSKFGSGLSKTKTDEMKTTTKIPMEVLPAKDRNLKLATVKPPAAVLHNEKVSSLKQPATNKRLSLNSNPDNQFNKRRETNSHGYMPERKGVQNVFQRLSLLSNSSSNFARPRSISARLLSTRSVQCEFIEDIVSYVNDKKTRNIIIMAGAGISTGSGIPDFRTPGTGLYDNLKQYKIPYPEAIFDIDYFNINPKPFFTLAKELYPSAKYTPNVVHYFCRLLNDKGMLLRLYTQNIDGLEKMAGIPPEKLVEAHGTFATATCNNCGRMYEGYDIREMVLRGEVPYCRRWHNCSGVIKPDIVFFSENLPRKFWSYVRDFPQADLLIVMGTSLEVEPFAGIVDATRIQVPRLLLNREAVGPFKTKRRMNDVVATGDLIELVREFSRQLGWEAELEKLCETRQAELETLHKQQLLSTPPPRPPTGAPSLNRRLSGRPTTTAGASKPNVPGRLPQHRNFSSSGSRIPSSSMVRAGSLPRLPPVVPNSRRQPPRYTRVVYSSSSSDESSDSSEESSTSSSSSTD